MASADCITSNGVYGAATSFKAGEGTCVIRSEPVSAASRVAWAGTTARRESVDWLPRADEQWIDMRTGRPTRRFFQFLREVAETRLGGVQGVTVPAVVQSVTDTQSSVTTVASFAQQVGQYAQGIAETVDATVQVTQDSSLSGSESIPPTPPQAPQYEP